MFSGVYFAKIVKGECNDKGKNEVFACSGIAEPPPVLYEDRKRCAQRQYVNTKFYGSIKIRFGMILFMNCHRVMANLFIHRWVKP